MIARLRGQVDSIGEDWVILDVGGVGYIAWCSARTLARLPPAGESAALTIETHVREDAITLYGFADAAERDWFRVLVTVQGVGARVALALLSVYAPDRLAQAIAAQDRAALTRAAGVGPKLAARLLTELKDRVAGLALSAGRSTAAGGSAAPAPADVDAGAAPADPSRTPVGSGGTGEAGSAETGLDRAMTDAVSALVNLGYGRSEAFAAVARVAEAQRGSAGVGGAGVDVAVLVRAALKDFARAQDRSRAFGPAGG